MKRTWSDVELQLLTDNYKNKSKDEMMLLLPEKTALQIKNKARYLGIKKINYFRLTSEQKKHIDKIYANTRTEDIALEMGCTKYCIYNYAFAKGLRKDPKFVIENARANFTEDHPAREYHYIAGHIPDNKGKKQTDYMSAEAIEKSKQYQFKPGHEVWNHKPIGYERIDKYGYIRVKTEEPNVFRFKHHVVYEENFGQIPKGHNVQFRNGIRTDCTPENLYLISRRDQLLTENGIMAIPEELKPTYSALRKLRKTIKKHEQKQESN